MRSRPLNIDAHNAIILAASPLLMLGPFLLAAGPGIGTLAFFLGAILLGTGLAGAGSARTIALTTQKSLDVAIAIALLGMGVAAAVLDGGTGVSLLLVGFGSALLALSAATRYTARIG